MKRKERLLKKTGFMKKNAVAKLCRVIENVMCEICDEQKAVWTCPECWSVVCDDCAEDNAGVCDCCAPHYIELKITTEVSNEKKKK